MCHKSLKFPLLALISNIHRWHLSDKAIVPEGTQQRHVKGGVQLGQSTSCQIQPISHGSNLCHNCKRTNKPILQLARWCKQLKVAGAQQDSIPHLKLNMAPAPISVELL